MQPVPPPPPRRQGMPIFVPILLFVIAAALLLPAVWITQNTLSNRSAARRVIGTVVKMELSSRSAARPVVRYTIDDRNYQIVAGIYQSPPAYAVGDQIELMYQPDQPGEARIDSFMENWFLPLMFGGFGLGTLLSGLVTWLIWVRQAEVHTSTYGGG